jgi:crossover junction endodeoxyribonuclease RuvC
MKAIGIDPGTYRTGFGVVQKIGTRLTRIASGTLVASDKLPMEQRLLAIHEGLERILTEHAPDEAAVEDVFFAKNAGSALKLGQVRGVILLTMTRRGIPLNSYPPALVKRAVVGSGRAQKDQVRRVVKAILGMDALPAEDEGDALAIAICHLNALRLEGLGPGDSKSPPRARRGPGRP